MKKLYDINVEDYKSALERITINIKNINQDNFSVIKCYKNFEEITIIECKKLNLIKIHKTIFLNLPNLIHVDLRDNKLLRISKNFKLLGNLKTLKLDDNYISFIPNLIGHFDKLDTLTICNNKISYIPTSIQYLQNLKVLKLSGNQIIKLPIEFGLLKSIECLHIDCNYFTEIPTTLCYLKHLSELSFEWLEFLDPPFSKVIKDSIGKTIICLIRNSLQDMVKHNMLYCDFQTFVERNSNSNSRRESPKKMDNNQVNDEPIISADTLPNRNTITHCTLPEAQADDKAITTTYNNTVEKENPTPISLPLGSNFVVHINGLHTNQVESSAPTPNLKLLKIFSAIENNYYGVIKSLIQNNEEYLKVKNTDNKMPLHLAIQVGKNDIINLILSKINFRTLQMQHTYLHKAIRLKQPYLVKKFVELGIDINAPDDQGSTCFHILFNTFNRNLSKCALIADFLLKNGATINNMNNDDWAPIHIAARRASKECLIWILQQNRILERSGKETFDLNASGKNKWTPLHLAANSFRIEESLLLLNSGCDVFAKNSDRRTPREVSNGHLLLPKLLRNYEDKILMKKYINRRENNLNHGTNHNCFITVEDSSNLDDASKDKTGDIFLSEYQSKADTIRNEKEEDSKAVLNTEKISVSVSSTLNNKGLSIGFSSQDTKKILFTQQECPKRSLNAYNYINITNEAHEVLHAKEQLKVNVYFHKEVILSNESSFSEKYESLMYIKLSSSSPKNRNTKMENLIKSIIEGLDLETEVNSIIFSDLCNIIVINQYFNLISFLEAFQNTFTGSTKKKNINAFLEKEITNTILILKAIQESQKRAVHDTQPKDNGEIMSLQNLKRNAKKVTQQIDKSSLYSSSERIIRTECANEALMMYNSNPSKHMRNIPKIKLLDTHINAEIESDRTAEEVHKQVDEYNYDEMNEIRESYIDLKAYNKNLPHKKIQKDNSDRIEDFESCNIQDSSISMALLDPPFNLKTAGCASLKLKKESNVQKENKDELFISIPPKKNEPVFLDTENAEQK